MGARLLYFVRVCKKMVVLGVLLCGTLVNNVPASAATRYEAGIATSATLLRMSDKDLDARLTDIQRLGATWIRVDFDWYIIQPHNANSYDWHLYDHIARVAQVHHLKILAVLAYTPAWAQEPRCAKLVITKAAGIKCNPKDNATFARFARAAAIRYKGSAVRAWEIWNEPNLSSYWKTAQPNSTAVHADVKAYAKLANAAALQISHYYPSSLIITGGLGPLFEPVYPKGYRQSDYLAQLLPLLERRLFDGIGIHPYSWPAMPSKAATYNAFYTVEHGNPQYNLRTIMSNAGWQSKQLWATEYGASTEGLSRALPTLLKRPDHVTEAAQAQIIKQGMDGWYDMANVGPMFVHSDSDQWLVSHKNEGGFGLRRQDGSKKPAFGAFQAAVQRLEYKK